MKDRKPFIDPRHFEFGPWQQELIWVQRNSLGIIVGYSERLPMTDNFVPTMPIRKKNSPSQGES